MPYATNGRVSDVPIAGGITITNFQYEQAIAAMSDPTGPRQVSKEGGFNLIAPSLPILATSTLQSATILPPVEGGRYPVCTGLARHPSGTGWLVGDDGRVNSNPPFYAGVIWYDDDWVEQGRFTWADYGIGNDNHSCQGLASNPVDGSFWALAKQPATTSHTIVHANATTGELIKTLPVGGTANGLAIVPEYNQILILTDSGNISRWSMYDGVVVGGAQAVPGDPMAQPDMLHYLGGGKLLVSYGENGSDGFVRQLDISTGMMTVERQFTMQGADAIEGVVVDGNTLYVCNDARFHPGSPAENRILEYDVTGLFP